LRRIIAAVTLSLAVGGAAIAEQERPDPARAAQLMAAAKRLQTAIAKTKIRDLYGDIPVTADSFTLRDNSVYASGNVRITFGDSVLVADSAVITAGEIRTEKAVLRWIR
jgi:lipopolysaccharide export system protein LptA